TQRLQQVKVSRLTTDGNDRPTRYYTLRATVPPNGTGPSILSSVQQCGSDGTTCLPESTFANLANRGRDGEFAPSERGSHYTDPAPLLAFPATVPSERNGAWDPGWGGTVGLFGGPELFGGDYGKTTLVGDYNGDGRPDAFFLEHVSYNAQYPYTHLRIRVIINRPSDQTTPGLANRFTTRDTETGQIINQPLWGYTNTAKADIANT